MKYESIKRAMIMAQMIRKKLCFAFKYKYHRLYSRKYFISRAISSLVGVQKKCISSFKVIYRVIIKLLKELRVELKYINFNIKSSSQFSMLADYVMKSIDNLFSDKLSTSNSQLYKQSSTSSTYFHGKVSFKETIKTTLPNVIRRDGNSKSPLRNKEKSPSPISKSRLRSILQDNRTQKIKSVVKRSSQIRQSSPYQKIEIENYKYKGAAQDTNQCQDLSNKENNMIRYYRQERKSTEKYKGAERTQKNGKSRIFMKGSLLGRESSTSNFP